MFSAVQVRESATSSPDIAIHAIGDEHSSAAISLLLLAALGLMVTEDELCLGVMSENCWLRTASTVVVVVVVVTNTVLVHASNTADTACVPKKNEDK